MKKIIKLLSVILIIYITAAALPKLMPAATLEANSDSDVMFQTWEEFLESGVKIEYGEVTAITDNRNNECWLNIRNIRLGKISLKKQPVRHKIVSHFLR